MLDRVLDQGSDDRILCTPLISLFRVRKSLSELTESALYRHRNGRSSPVRRFEALIAPSVPTLSHTSLRHRHHPRKQREEHAGSRPSER